jgi:hypothetical protein
MIMNDSENKDLIYYIDDNRDMHCSYMTEEEFEAAYENFLDVGDPAMIWWPGEVPVMPTKPTPLDEGCKASATTPKGSFCQPPCVGPKPTFTPEKKRDFSPTYYEEPRYVPPLNEGGE